MSYRSFQSEADQADAEATTPERFTSGQEWLALTERAKTSGGARLFEPAEWSALVGGQQLPLTEKITAAKIWELLPDYEAARLSATWVTLDGLTALQEMQTDIYKTLRTLRAPNDITGYRIAASIIDAAMVDPDRRPDFIKLARQHDALGVQLYRAPRKQQVPTMLDRVRGLQPGRCMPITEDEHKYLAANPIRGFYVERYGTRSAGGWHVCAGTQGQIGFGVRW